MPARARHRSARAFPGIRGRRLRALPRFGPESHRVRQAQPRPAALHPPPLVRPPRPLRSAAAKESPGRWVSRVHCPTGRRPAPRRCASLAARAPTSSPFLPAPALDRRPRLRRGLIATSGASTAAATGFDRGRAGRWHPRHRRPTAQWRWPEALVPAAARAAEGCPILAGARQRSPPHAWILARRCCRPAAAGKAAARLDHSPPAAAQRTGRDREGRRAAKMLPRLRDGARRRRAAWWSPSRVGGFGAGPSQWQIGRTHPGKRSIRRLESGGLRPRVDPVRSPRRPWRCGRHLARPPAA